MFVTTDIWMSFHSVCFTVKSIRDVLLYKNVDLYGATKRYIITFETVPERTKHPLYTEWKKWTEFKMEKLMTGDQ